MQLPPCFVFLLKRTGRSGRTLIWWKWFRSELFKKDLRGFKRESSATQRLANIHYTNSCIRWFTLQCIMWLPALSYRFIVTPNHKDQLFIQLQTYSQFINWPTSPSHCCSVLALQRVKRLVVYVRNLQLTQEEGEDGEAEDAGGCIHSGKRAENLAASAGERRWIMSLERSSIKAITTRSDKLCLMWHKGAISNNALPPAQYGSYLGELDFAD